MRFRTAVIWNGLSQAGQSGVQFLSTVILARLLTPSDFGIIGIVTIFMTIGTMMVDSEMGGALLRKRDVTQTDYSTLFFYNFGISIFIYGVLFGIAPLISDFYGKPDLTIIIRIISLTVIVHAFRVVQQIMIFRELDFKSYAIISVSSGLLSLGVAIILAMNGAGYWALVMQYILGAFFMVIFMIMKNRFFPSFVFSKESFKYQFDFGIKLLCSDLVRVIANNINLNIFAKFAPLQLTGNFTQYSRITTFGQNFFSALMNQSIFPMLAKIDKVAKLIPIYLRLFNYITVGTGLFTIVLLVYAKPIINLLLGKEWLSAIWIFQILAIAVYPFCIQVLCRNMLKSVGSTGVVLKFETIKSIVIIGLLCLSVLGGVKTIVWATAVGQSMAGTIGLLLTEKELEHSAGRTLSLYFASSAVLYAIVIIL